MAFSQENDGGIVEIGFIIKQSLSFASLNSSLYTREPFVCCAKLVRKENLLSQQSLSEILARGGGEVRGGDIQNGFAANKALLFHAVSRARAGYENT